MAAEVLEQHGRVDILVNNAGKSIRRSVISAYDRFHDYQRTMQLNYFAPVKLILDLLPGMRERGIGPHHECLDDRAADQHARFSRLPRIEGGARRVQRSIAPEIIDDGVHVTTVYMPLVRTPMIAPTKIYDRFPTLSPEEAAHMIAEAIRKRPKRIATTLGNIGQLTYAIAPGAQDLRRQPRLQAVPRGRQGTARSRPTASPAEQRAFARATRGVTGNDR